MVFYVDVVGVLGVILEFLISPLGNTVQILFDTVLFVNDAATVKTKISLLFFVQNICFE